MANQPDPTSTHPELTCPDMPYLKSRVDGIAEGLVFVLLISVLVNIWMGLLLFLVFACGCSEFWRSLDFATRLEVLRILRY